MMLALLEATAPWTTISDGVTQLITAITSVFTYITSAAVAPYFLIGVSIGVIGFAIATIKHLVWGA